MSQSEPDHGADCPAAATIPTLIPVPIRAASSSRERKPGWPIHSRARGTASREAWSPSGSRPVRGYRLAGAAVNHNVLRMATTERPAATVLVVEDRPRSTRGAAAHSLRQRLRGAHGGRRRRRAADGARPSARTSSFSTSAYRSAAGCSSRASSETAPSRRRC